jgi:hypothetical protein
MKSTSCFLDLVSRSWISSFVVVGVGLSVEMEWKAPALKLRISSIERFEKISPELRRQFTHCAVLRYNLRPASQSLLTPGLPIRTFRHGEQVSAVQLRREAGWLLITANGQLHRPSIPGSRRPVA